MVVLRTKDLTFSYPERDTVLENINIEIEKGDFVLLVGKSGSGKSTLLRLLKKEAVPHGTLAGEVYAGDLEIGGMSALESAGLSGFVGQDPDAQIVTDKVWHELAFGPESIGLENSEIRRAISETSDYFGLQGMLERNTDELSGGQKQILNLASAMVMNPKILLLDEPTSRLDPVSAQKFMDFVVRLNRDFGVTVIIAEHRYDMVLGAANKVCIVKNKNVELFTDMSLACAGMMEAELTAGMPAFVRIWDVYGREGKCPRTIRDGKRYLAEKKAATQCGLIDKINDYSGDPCLTANNISFRYTKNGADAVYRADVEIPKAKITSVVGGNGAGKSTLMSILAGLRTPYEGNVKFEGKKLSSFGRDLWRKISMMPQNPKILFVNDTVRADLLEPCHDISKEEAEKRLANVVEMCGIAHLLNRHPYDISGGELQLSAFARTLMQDSEVLLMDEPTKGMDPDAKAVFAKILLSLKEKGKTIVIVTHDIDFAAETADYCIYMSAGKVISCGVPKEFFGGNRFYSTVTAKTVSEIMPAVVTVDRLLEVLKNEK